MRAIAAALENRESANQPRYPRAGAGEGLLVGDAEVYRFFESRLPSPTRRVAYVSPGGHSRTAAAGKCSRAGGEVAPDRGALLLAAATLCRPPKVTPSSKVVGDLALHLVAVGADRDDFDGLNTQDNDIPDSVVGLHLGDTLGDPPGVAGAVRDQGVLEGQVGAMRDVELAAADSGALDEKGRVRGNT